MRLRQLHIIVATFWHIKRFLLEAREGNMVCVCAANSNLMGVRQPLSVRVCVAKQFRGVRVLARPTWGARMCEGNYLVCACAWENNWVCVGAAKSSLGFMYA